MYQLLAFTCGKPSERTRDELSRNNPTSLIYQNTQPTIGRCLRGCDRLGSWSGLGLGLLQGGDPGPSSLTVSPRGLLFLFLNLDVGPEAVCSKQAAPFYPVRERPRIT